MFDLKETFEMQAVWRRGKAAEYPQDGRNLEAAEIFDRLAATAGNVPPEVLEAADELFDGAEDMEIWQDMLREVGFHSAPANAEEFVREFIASCTS